MFDYLNFSHFFQKKNETFVAKEKKGEVKNLEDFDAQEKIENWQQFVTTFLKWN